MPSTLVRGLAIAALALAAPALTHAQTAPELRAGRWAGEASLGPGGLSGALLRFTSPSAAWLVGVNFELERTTVDDDSELLPGEEADDAGTNVNLGARLGFRRYAGAGSAIRPVTGVGVLGSVFRLDQGASLNEQSAVGAYGELGAVYLFSSRVSLGAAGELRATYNVDRLSGPTFSRRASGFGVGGSLARVMATVYF